MRTMHAMRGRAAAAAGLLAAALAFTVAVPARAGDWPLASGDFWEIASIRLKDGGEFQYAKFLASEWKANQEFAKSKGWIKSYMIFSNSYNRKGEPDLYLVTVTDRLPSGPEGEKRNDEYLAWRKSTNEQLVKESGNRLEFREVDGTTLWQELKIK